MIGIVTVYYSENAGTLLQAYSLSCVLKELGHDSVFISTKTRYSGHSIKMTTARFIKELAHLRVNNAWAALKKYHSFSKIIKLFKVIKFNEIDARGITSLVIGSDTVWDADARYFYDALESFWPISSGTNIISYAAAVANTSAETLEKLERPRACLKNMKHISVRDYYSKNVIEKLCDKNAEVVCDPTLLANPEIFDKFKCKVKHSNYILVYMAEELSEEYINSIVSFARGHNLKILTLGKKYVWSDIHEIISLESFISSFAGADYIISNTFHGTVFSIIFNKKFVCPPCNKNKIDELMKTFDLTERKVSSSSELQTVLTKSINYELVNTKIEEIRFHSMSFLKNALKSCGEEATN